MLASAAWSATEGQATFEPDDELDEPEEPDDEPDEPDDPDDDEPGPDPDEDEPAPWLAFLSPDDPESPEPDPPEPESESVFAPLEPLAAARLASALLRLSVR